MTAEQNKTHKQRITEDNSEAIVVSWQQRESSWKTNDCVDTFVMKSELSYNGDMNFANVSCQTDDKTPS